MTEKLAVVVAAVTFALMSCSSPPADAPSNCLVHPTCRPGKVEVGECDGEEGCEAVSICGVTIHCANGGEITSDNYDADCESAEDCRLIFEGDPCACHECETGAVADFVYADYEADWAAAMCEPDCQADTCSEPRTAVCEDGRCVPRETWELNADCDAATDEASCLAAGCGTWTTVWDVTGSDGSSEEACESRIVNRCFRAENAVANSGICSVWWRATDTGVEVIRLGPRSLYEEGWRICENTADEPPECMCALHLGCHLGEF